MIGKWMLVMVAALTAAPMAAAEHPEVGPYEVSGVTGLVELWAKVARERANCLGGEAIGGACSIECEESVQGGIECAGEFVAKWTNECALGNDCAFHPPPPEEACEATNSEGEEEPPCEPETSEGN